VEGGGRAGRGSGRRGSASMQAHAYSLIDTLFLPGEGQSYIGLGFRLRVSVRVLIETLFLPGEGQS